MAETLLITKKSTKTWIHQPSNDLQFIIGKFTFSIDGDFFQIVELGQSKRNKYNFADITVYDETTDTTYESFTSIVDLSTTLETLGYPAFLRDGEVTGVASVNGLTGIVVLNGTNIDVTDPTTSTDATLNDALANIYASGGGGSVTSVNGDTGVVVVDLQSAVDQSGVITDGTDTNTVSASGLVLTRSDMTNDIFTEISPINITLTDNNTSNQASVSLNSYMLVTPDGNLIIYPDKITVNSVDYPLPTGASSQIATLADITGGVSDGDKGDITVSSGGTVWTIDNGLDASKLADGSVSNTEFQRLNGVTSDIQPQLNQKDVLPVLFEKHANVPIFGSATLNNLEGVGFTVAGGTSRTFSDTSSYTRRQRLGLTVSVTGNLGQARQTITYYNRNSNLHVLIGVGFAENCTNANVRAFAGITSNTGVFSNVEPTALINCFGIAKLTTSNNLHLVHNDGSGTATAVDLGASFPTNTIETDFYLLEVKTNGSNLDYVVTRVNTGDTASGSVSTDIPATTQALNLGYYVVQSTGANTTTGIDYFGTNLIKS